MPTKTNIIGIDADTKTSFFFDSLEENDFKMGEPSTAACPGVELDVHLSLLAEKEDSDEGHYEVGTATVELFDSSDYMDAMDAHSQDFWDLACNLTEDSNNDPIPTGTLKEKYLLPTNGEQSFVAVLTHVRLKEEASSLNGARYIMENIYTILDSMFPCRIEVVIYDSFWDDEKIQDETRKAALEAGFCEVEGNQTALYLPMSKISK